MSYNLVDPTTGDLTRVAGGTLYADVPVGTILSFSGTSVPAGYLLCDGREVSRIDYSNLFTVIGTTFGAGDGSTTFNIPDLRGRFIEGSNEANVVGKHIEAGLPNITGSFYSDSNASDASGVFYYKRNGAVNLKNDEIKNSGDIHFDASRASTIYGKSDTVQPDSVCVNYIIKAMSASLPFDFTEYVKNQNLLSDLENITLSTNGSNPSIMEYDGFLICYHNYGHIIVNGTSFPLGQAQPSGVYNVENTNTIPVKKGDSVYTDVTPTRSIARFYKQRDYGGR